jgi:predicted NBD/HSP70 family sugar kinase
LLEAAGLPAEAGTAVGGPVASVAELVRRALTGEPTTLLALEKVGTALGIALSAFLNVLDLPTVVLGGFYAELAPWLIGPVTGELHDRVVNHPWSPIEVIVSSLGAEASVRGAAGITIRRIIDDPAASFPEVLALTRT